MKITEVVITPLAIPDPPLRNSWGVHEPYALRVVVELKTDEGLSGWGEGYGGQKVLDALEGARPHLTGADPFQIEPLRRRITDVRVFSILEPALLDLMGKAAGRPVCDLLGGRLRDEIEFSAYLFYKLDGDDPWGEVMTPEAMVEEAKRFHREYGFTVHKLKGGVLPPEEEVETLRLMRQALGPDAKFRIDPNARWSLATSIRIGKMLEPIGIEYYEDPCRGMEAMAEVRRNVAIPTATNMCVTAFDHLPKAMELMPVDVILTDHHYWGGLVSSIHLSRFCGDFGLGASMHSNTHLGITMAAMCHLAAAMPHLTHACDTHYPWIEEDIIVGEGFKFHNGRTRVPTGPGLGVEVDRNKLMKLHENYLRCGIRERDDTGEMKKRFPNWEPVLEW